MQKGIFKTMGGQVYKGEVVRYLSLHVRFDLFLL